MKKNTMRLTILLVIFALTTLNPQTTDPNKSGFPHDMTWFNVPKNPQPGVVHKGYRSASMDKERTSMNKTSHSPRDSGTCFSLFLYLFNLHLTKP